MSTRTREAGAVGEGELSPETVALAAQIERARGGDPRAFRRLMEAYQNAFYGVARRFTGTHEDADDVLQEAFLKIYQNLAGLERPEAFFPWARRILVNTALDHIRRRRRAAAFETEPSDEHWEHHVESGVAPPDQLVEEHEFFEKLGRALRVLPPRQREVVLLHDVEGLTTEEISGRLEIPRATVRSNLFYGREKLRRMLGRNRYGPGSV
jgi:RNA polymerase sigma-70 factor (ECF subfamily)